MKYLIAALIALNMTPATQEPQHHVHIHPLYKIQEAMDKETEPNKSVENNKQIIKEILNNDK